MRSFLTMSNIFFILNMEKMAFIEMEKKGTELFEILNIELNNRDTNDEGGDPVNIKILPDPANFEVNFSSPLRLRAGGSCMVTDAYLSFFDGQTVEPGDIIIEKDYNFSMEFCFLWTNTVDQLQTSGAPETKNIPMGYTSILTNSGVPYVQTINIEIKAGSYSPSSLVELFNRQTLMPTYLNYAKDGKIYNPPANAAVFGNSLPFNTIAEFVPSTNAFLLYTPGVSTVFDPDYGYQITSDMDTSGLYSIPMTQPLIYGSNGFTLNFDSNTQRFSILSNFMPITSTDSNSLVVLRMNDATTAGGRIFIDRTGEVLVQRWGYTISEWKNSFWYRLGFEWSDLIKTSPTDKNLFGRVYADINNLAVNQTIPQGSYASNGLQALNLQQGAILMANSGNNAYKAMSYDGNNLPIIASKSPNLIPLGYCRARLDLQIVGGGSNGSNLYGFTQAISLLNISAAGITSFSILNPCPFMFASDMNIKSIRVFLQDPRNDSRLSWISKQNLSALFLRIQQPIS